MPPAPALRTWSFLMAVDWIILWRLDNYDGDWVALVLVCDCKCKMLLLVSRCVSHRIILLVGLPASAYLIVPISSSPLAGGKRRRKEQADVTVTRSCFSEHGQACSQEGRKEGRSDERSVKCEGSGGGGIPRATLITASPPF
jgi:hypothetical protein